MNKNLLTLLFLITTSSAIAQHEQTFLTNEFIVDGVKSDMSAFEAGIGTVNCKSTLGFETIIKECGSCNVSGVALGYRVYKPGNTPGSFITTNASRASATTDLLGCDDVVWNNLSIQSNVLQNLENGTYQLDIYFQSDGTACDPTLLKSAEYSTTFIYNKEPIISFQPIDLVSCLGGDSFFKTSATGVGALIYQWQISDGGAAFTNLLSSSKFKGVNTKSLHLNGLGATDRQDLFRCLVTDANGCSVITQAAKTEVNRFGSISVPNLTLCEGINTEFIANVTYGDTVSAQWEYQLFGSSAYMNVVASANYSGVNSSKLSITNLPKDYRRYRVSGIFKAITSGDNGGQIQSTCSAISSARTFVINPAPQKTALSDIARCGKGVINIIAPFDTTGYRWYTDTTKAAVSTTKTYNPNLTNTQNLYFSYLNAKSCESYRTEFTATVNSIPAITLGSVADICPGVTSVTLPFTNLTAGDLYSITSADAAGFTAVIDASILSAPIKLVLPNTLTAATYNFVLKLKSSNTKCESPDIPFTVRMKAPTIITTQPIAAEACEGEAATFTVTATGEGVISYQWLKDGNPITNKNSTTLPFATVVLGDADNYSCRVTAECGAEVSDAVALTVKAKTVVTQQPQGLIKCEGQSAVFAVNATGSGTLSYQWKKNGITIGTNSNLLTLVDLQNSDNNAQLTCTVTSTECGSVTSDVAKLTVILLPNAPIVTSPTGFCKAETATSLSATPTGANTLLWWGTDASGGTSSATAPTPSTTTVGSKIYYVSQQDTYGCEGPRSAIEVIISSPVTVSISASQRDICATGILNKSAILQALPSGGNGTFTYEWRNSNGTLLAEDKVSITVSAASTYTVKATSAFCNAEESFIINAILPELTEAPTAIGASICHQEAATLMATSTYTGGDFRWYDVADGTAALSSANPLIISNLTSSRTVYVAYRKASGLTFCETPRKTVNITVGSQLIVTAQPTNIIRCKDNTATFSSVITNASSYQWQRKLPGGVFENMLGETNSDLRIFSIGNSTNPHLTQYRLIASSGSCSVTTNAAILFVNSKDGNLDSQTACLGSDVTFSVPATTGRVQSYEWQKRIGSSGSFNKVVGATFKDLFLANVGIADDNTYYRCRLVFDNGDGSTCVITTDDGRLTVKQVGVSLSKEDVQCFGGATGSITVTALGSSGYSYRLGSGSFQTSNKFENLSAGTYAVTVKDGSGCSITENIGIAEPAKLLISSLLTTPATCDGATGSITFDAIGGVGTLKFKLNDGDLKTISSFQTLSGGIYKLTVEDGNGCSLIQNNIVVGGKSVPVIAMQPANLINCEGNIVTFEVAASNVASYQWQKQLPNGTFTDISGESSRELRISNVGNSANPHLAKYRVLLQNDGCDVFSEIATLHVNSITGSTESKIRCTGTDYTLDLTNYTLTGTVSAYQWQYRSGTSGSWNDLTNRESNSLILTNLQTSSSGYYRCRVTFVSSNGTCIKYNEAGNGLKVEVVDNTSPVIAADKFVVCDGIPAKLTASGCSGVVKWSTGEKSVSITVLVAGSYTATCELGNCESKKSNSIDIQSGIAPTTPVISTNKLAICGTEMVEITANNCNGFLRWSTGSNATSIVAGPGTYTANCTTLCGTSALSNEITITTEGIPTGGTIEAVSTTNCAGYNPPTIGSIVNPTGANLIIQWQQRTTSGDWNDIVGGTSLTYNPGTLNDTTLYRRRIFNTCGEAFSNVDTIYIAPDPGVIVSSSKSLVCSNETFTLEAVITGGSGNCPVSWQRNNRSSAPTSSFWENISGTTSSLTINSFVNSSVGNVSVYYRAVVDCQPSSCNKATSDAAQVVVRPSFEITLNFSDSTICEGNSVDIVAGSCGGTILWSTGASTTTINVSPVTSTSYTAICTNSCGSSSKMANITVLTGGVPVPVNTTPSNVVTPATLTFAANGTNLKWYTTETGGTGTHIAPSFTNLGTYTYWVTQSDGRCESNRLKISATIYPLLALGIQSGNQYDCKGNSVQFFINAVGAGKLTYQWQRKRPAETEFIDLTEDGNGIKFFYEANMRVSGVGNNNNPHLTKYRCVVRDIYGTIVSNEMTLYVNSLQGTFKNIGACIGANYNEDIKVLFKITGDVSTYQWQRRSGTSGPWNNLTNTDRLKGTASSRLQISPLQYADGNMYYRCQVTFNTAGLVCTENTDPSKLTVSGYPPAPPNLAAEYCQGDNAKRLSYTTGNSNDVLWYTSAAQQEGETKAPAPETGAAGEFKYFVSEVTPEGCESPKTDVIVRIYPQPAAPVSTTPAFVKEGSALKFTAAGETLRWFTSRTGRTYDVESPIYFKPKLYKHYVSQLSAFGCESERTYIEAEIREVLKITTMPTNESDCSGNSVTFSANATSFGNVIYQWERRHPNDGAYSKLNGETKKSLTIKDIGQNGNINGTFFRCIVKDLEDSLITVPAQLIVNEVIGEIPNVAFCEGQKIVLDSTKIQITGLVEQYEWQRQSGRNWLTIDSTSKWLDLGVAESNKTADYRLKVVFRVNNRTTCNRYSRETKVVVNIVPTAPITTDYTVCKLTQQKPKIVSSTNKNRVWWYASSTDSIGQSEPPANLSSTVGKKTLYVAERSDKGCESKRTPLNFTTIPPPPKPLTDSLLNVCQFASDITLNATSADEILWSIGNEDDFQEKRPKLLTQKVGLQQFYVAAIDTNGCLSANQRILLNVEPCVLSTADVPAQECNSLIRENVNGSEWVNFFNTSGKLVASINPGGQNLGTVTLNYRLYIDELKTPNGTPLFGRYFNLSSSVANPLSRFARVRLYAFNDEIAAFNQNLEWFVVHYEGINEDCDPTNNDNLGQGRSVVLNSEISVTPYTNVTSFIEFATPSFSEFGLTSNPFARVKSILTGAGNQVVIESVISDETRPLKYILERSLNGKTWYRWQEVKAGGINKVIDNRPLNGNSYYRIIYQDLDGTLKYFAPLPVELNDSAAICTVFPNPIIEDFKIQLYVRNMQPKTFDFFDVHMRKWGVLVNNTEPNNYELTLSSSLAHGVYFLQLTDSEENTCVVKIVKR